MERATPGKKQDKFAKDQAKKNGVGTIYFDPYGDRVLEISIVDGEYALTPVIGAPEDTAVEASRAETESGQKTKTIGTDTVVDKISPQDVGFKNKPVFENITELLSVIEFPMTGKELKAQYEFVFPINEKTTFYPRKK